MTKAKPTSATKRKNSGKKKKDGLEESSPEESPFFSLRPAGHELLEEQKMKNRQLEQENATVKRRFEAAQAELIQTLDEQKASLERQLEDAQGDYSTCIQEAIDAASEYRKAMSTYHKYVVDLVE